ncbi:MAG: hypothetical protein ACD_69C00365G0001 [uncultured bacterium]|nr:MAG: hypothetical protein ACD_69C00365G0001 [uncultured bacterium]
MLKITTFLNEDTVLNLKELCKNTGKSLSKTIAELVEAGYQIKHNDDTEKTITHDEKNTELALKHTEFLLRILNINTEILRKVYNEPSKCTEKTVDLKLDEIKTHVQKLVEAKLGKA